MKKRKFYCRINAMLITIGTKNSAKVQALRESLQAIPDFKSFIIESFAVESGVSDQPLTVATTVLGAKNRSYHAYQHASSLPKYSFGIESGLIEAPGTRSGFLNVCVCCIFDGKEYYTGFSTGFEVPMKVLKHVLDHKLNLSQACLASGISSNAKIGEQEGLIGILTHGKVNRLEYTKECINTALIQLINHTWYKEPLGS